MGSLGITDRRCRTAGRIFCNLKGLSAVQGDNVRFYIMALGDEVRTALAQCRERRMSPQHRVTVNSCLRWQMQGDLGSLRLCSDSRAIDWGSAHKSNTWLAKPDTRLVQKLVLASKLESLP